MPPRRAPVHPPSTKYLCANCDEYFIPEGGLSPFCSQGCKAQANVVRAFRAAFTKYGRNSLPDDVRDALRIVMAHALSGGYDAKARHLPKAVPDFVIGRDRGLCVMCGAAGTEIDHIDGPDPDPSNLRLLCHACHVAVTMTHLRPLDGNDAALEEGDADDIAGKRDLFDRLTSRIDRDVPERACDGPEWATQWRGWAKANATSIQS